MPAPRDPDRPLPPRAEPSVEELRAEARYARERVDLYRAKAYAGRATTATRARELDRISAGAEGRLKAALRARDAAAPGG